MPVVLSRDEVGRVLRHLTGRMWVIVGLLYGSGLRLQECLELRVKDVDTCDGRLFASLDVIEKRLI